jgi:hypothetical protein
MLGASATRADPMTDFTLVALTLAFFAVSIAYLRGCERI